MTATEDRKFLAQSKAAGRAYAAQTVESDTFHDWLVEMVDRMIKDDMLRDIPATKKRALRVAKDVLSDVLNDMQRDISIRDMPGLPFREDYYPHKKGVTVQDCADAWWDGVFDFLKRKTVQSWVADEILFQIGERMDYFAELGHWGEEESA